MKKKKQKANPLEPLTTNMKNLRLLGFAAFLKSAYKFLTLTLGLQHFSVSP